MGLIIAWTNSHMNRNLKNDNYLGLRQEEKEVILQSYKK